MEKYAWKAKLKEGKKDEYVLRHDQIWKEMKDLLKSAGICNYSIWITGNEIFGYYDKDIVKRLREVVFEEFAKSENYGMIFTYMWAFDMQSDWDYIHCVSTLFEEHGAEVYYVELVAPQEIRLQRNETENRLKHKASKRNLEFSRRTLLGADEKHRIESLDGEILFENYIKIDNSNLEPSEVAVMIKERFEL